MRMIILLAAGCAKTIERDANAAVKSPILTKCRRNKSRHCAYELCAFQISINVFLQPQLKIIQPMYVVTKILIFNSAGSSSPAFFSVLTISNS